MIRKKYKDVGYLIKKKVLLTQSDLNNSSIKDEIKKVIKAYILEGTNKKNIIKVLSKWCYEFEERYIWMLSNYFNRRYPLDNYYQILNIIINYDKGFTNIYKDNLGRVIEEELMILIEEVLINIFFNSY